MNVPDPVNASIPFPVVPERREEKAAASKVRDARPPAETREEQTAGQGSVPESRDRFTATEIPDQTALYDVTRVSSGRSHAAETSDMVDGKTLRGERVARKMADIPLATGRNLLHIYQRKD
jgi:hypothetical protein